MKKIPTLFERTFANHHVVACSNKVTPGFEWVLAGEGLATIKYDGSCCSIIDGVFYKRYDAKQGKKVPEGAIQCQPEADPVTGHLPCWVKVDNQKPEDIWFWSAYITSSWNGDYHLPDGTYEALGPHFQGNPYKLADDILIPHGKDIVPVTRSYENIKIYLELAGQEGLVFWKDGEPKVKVKASDFGINWKASIHPDISEHLMRVMKNNRRD